MNRVRVFMYILGVVSFLIFLATWVFFGIQYFGNGVSAEKLLPASYVMAGAFIVFVPCLLTHIYRTFDRKYRSEHYPESTEDNK